MRASRPRRWPSSRRQVGLPVPRNAPCRRCARPCIERRKVFINYRDLADKPSERTLRPLGCFYWGKVWTLAAWCEQRNDFRASASIAST